MWLRGKEAAESGALMVSAFSESCISVR
jgi:hypothetical protein